MKKKKTHTQRLPKCLYNNWTTLPPTWIYVVNIWTKPVEVSRVLADLVKMPNKGTSEWKLSTLFLRIVGGWSPSWVHSARRPLNGLLYLPRVIMMMLKLVEWRLAGETEVLG
jgi:hypothetical protein